MHRLQALLIAVLCLEGTAQAKCGASSKCCRHTNMMQLAVLIQNSFLNEQKDRYATVMLSKQTPKLLYAVTRRLCRKVDTHVTATQMQHASAGVHMFSK